MKANLIFASRAIFAGVLTAALCPAVALAQQGTRDRIRDDQTNSRERMNTRMIQSRIERRIARSGALAGSNITVQVTGDRVTLTGTVPDQQARERARRMALRTPGVEEVDDQLTINAAAADQWRKAEVTDEQLAKQVAQKLASDFFQNAKAEESWLFGWEVDGDNFEFAVEVDGGDVQLDGTIPARTDMSKLLQTVRTMPGVRSVDSALRYPIFGYNTPYGYGPPYGYGWGYGPGAPYYGYGPYWGW